MVHTENLYNSLKHYFDALENTGYYDEKGTSALLIYTFIVDAILEGPMQSYVEDEDLVVLNKVFECLSRNHCLISRIMPRQRISKPRQYYNPSIYRITQAYFPRTMEEDGLKRTEHDRR